MSTLAIFPSIVLLYYIYKNDKREKEPMNLLIGLFISGVIIIIPAMIMESIIEPIVEFFFTEGSVFYAIFDGFIVAAFSEEVLKYLALKHKTWKSAEFNCSFDGIVYAVFVSLGFATFENIMYVMNGDLSTAIVRMFTAVPSHACDAVYMGYFYSKAKHANILGNIDLEKKYIKMSLIVPILMHGLYDCLISFEEDIAGNDIVTIGILLWLVFIVVLFFTTFELVKKASRQDTYFYEIMNTINNDSPFKLKPGKWICSCRNINNGNYCVNCGAKRP